MSIRDYYILCHTCKEKVFVTSQRINGVSPVNQEVADFIVKHGAYHYMGIGDEEDEYISSDEETQ